MELTENTSGEDGASEVSSISAGGISDCTTISRAQPRSPVHSSLDECTRLIIFNIGRTTVQQAWEELRYILLPGFVDQIVKLRRVTYRSHNPHFDMWVERAAAAPLVSVIRDQTRCRTHSFVTAMKQMGQSAPTFRATVVGSWRPAIWEPWRDRLIKRRPVTEVRLRPPGRSLMTWNVNGFHSKLVRISDILSEKNIGVVALQETLVSEANYPIIMKGYRVYEVKRKEGFRGQALLVDNRYASYEVPHDALLVNGSHWGIHVKVAGICGDGRPLHVLAIYLRSGGNFRGERTTLLRSLSKVVSDILRKEPGAQVVCLGDFNTQPEELDKKLKAAHSSLARMIPKGSGLSRFPINGRARSLDHMIGSQSARDLCKRPRVLRRFAISDHRPVVTQILAQEARGHTGVKAPDIRYNLKMVNRFSEQIANHNRWNCLPVEEIESVDELNEATIQFSETAMGVMKDCQVVSAGGREPDEKLPRNVKDKLDRMKRYARKVAKEMETSGSPAERTKGLFRKARKSFKTAKKDWESKQKRKKFERIADDFVAHNHKNVWRRLKEQVEYRERGSALQPVRDRAGTLRTDTGGILETTKDHYEHLATDDPEGLANNQEHWRSIDMGPDLPALDGLNGDLGWTEVLVAIRGMNRNTAPGKCGMHVNTLKSVVVEECMAKIQNDNEAFRRPDNVRVNLPFFELPTDPLTPFGKALWRVLKAVWALETIPQQWNEVYICNLLKTGDPELLQNYRGISLISVTLKVLLAVMADRLDTALEGAGLLVKEQAGFRRGEEAIAQLISMAEVVRRRHLADKSTVGIFIDFKKAYDKVHHEALYRVMDHMGV